MPVLLKGDLDAAKAQMVAAALRLSCATAKNDALPHGRLVVEHRVDWRVVLHGDETSPGRIEERHLPVRGGEQVPAADPGQDCRGVRCVLALTLTKNLANSPSSD